MRVDKGGGKGPNESGEESDELALASCLGFLKRESRAVQGKGGRNGVPRLSHLWLVPHSLPEVLNNGFSEQWPHYSTTPELLLVYVALE